MIAITIIAAFIIGCLLGMRYERRSKVTGLMKRASDRIAIDDRLRRLI